MAEITVNVTGITGGSSGGQPPVPPQTPTPPPTNPQTPGGNNGGITGGGSQPSQPTQPTQPTPNPPQPQGGGGGVTSGNPPQGGGTPTQPQTPITPPPGGGTTPVDNRSLVGGGNNPMTNPNSGSQPWSISSDQMLANMRREMQSRGIMLVPGTATYSQFLEQVRKQQQDKNNQDIEEHFGDLRSEAANDYFTKLAELTNSNNAQRQNALAGITDPNVQQRINDHYDQIFERQKGKLVDEYDAISEQYREGGAAESGAKAQAERELTAALRQLTDEINRGNKDSYMGELRDRYKTAIYQRDNAATKEEAQMYSRQAAEIQKEITETLSPKQRNAFAQGIFGPVTPVLSLGTQWTNQIAQLYSLPYQNQMAHIQSLGQFANGDPFGAMMNENELKRQNYSTIGSAVGLGIGAVVGGILAPFTGGMSLVAGIGLGGGLGAGAGAAIGNMMGVSATKEGDVLAKLGQQFQQLEQKIKVFNDLTMITNPGEGEMTFEGERDYLMNLLANGWNDPKSGLSNRELGMDAATFAQMVSSRIKARGMWDNLTDSYNRAMMSEGLEKVFGLSQNSLSQMGAYDRYGNDANQAVTNLFSTLSNRNVTGMSDGHYLRSNEFLGYMQQMMQQQKGWMNPNANFAARQVATMQQMFGDNLDERAMSEMNQINNAVTNPGGGYASVITNDVIQRLFPQTRGNLLAIREKQYSNNPAIREQIQRAMFQRLTQMYGSVNTTSGYMALSQYTGIQDPDRLRAWVNQMKNGYASVEKGDQNEAVSKLTTGYTPELTKQVIQGSDQAMLAINENSKRMGDMSEKIFAILNKNMEQIAKDLSEINLKVH